MHTAALCLSKRRRHLPRPRRDGRQGARARGPAGGQTRDRRWRAGQYPLSLGIGRGDRQPQLCGGIEEPARDSQAGFRRRVGYHLDCQRPPGHALRIAGTGRREADAPHGSQRCPFGRDRRRGEKSPGRALRSRACLHGCADGPCEDSRILRQGCGPDEIRNEEFPRVRVQRGAIQNRARFHIPARDKGRRRAAPHLGVADLRSPRPGRRVHGSRGENRRAGARRIEDQHAG